MKGGDLSSAKELASELFSRKKDLFSQYTKIYEMDEEEFRKFCERKLRETGLEEWSLILSELDNQPARRNAGGIGAPARSEEDDMARAIAASLASDNPAPSGGISREDAVRKFMTVTGLSEARAMTYLTRPEVDFDIKKAVELFFGDPDIGGGAVAAPAPVRAAAAREKYRDFFDKGGRVIEAPDQEEVTQWVRDGRKPWSIGIHPTDFLIPVCHQGMNRSQVMRLVLISVRKQLEESLGLHPTWTDTEWVSRAHGAVTGCDAHSAYKRGTLNEDNFFSYMFDVGEIFEDSYDPERDEDPQSGPLQRGFVEAFGIRKKPRFGEEMARGKKLNPTSEHVLPREWLEIEDDREYTHRWFNTFMFAPMTRIRDSARVGALAPHTPRPDQNMIPPPTATRRIFFAFARAVPNLVDRLLEVPGGPRNTVIVSLQYDDTMNHELRHCKGKTEAEIQDKMKEVHENAYKIYANLVHADPTPGPPAASELADTAPMGDAPARFVEIIGAGPAAATPAAPAGEAPAAGPAKDFSRMTYEQLKKELKIYKLTRNTIRDTGGNIGEIQADIDKIQKEMIKFPDGAR